MWNIDRSTELIHSLSLFLTHTHTLDGHSGNDNAKGKIRTNKINGKNYRKFVLCSKFNNKDKQIRPIFVEMNVNRRWRYNQSTILDSFIGHQIFFFLFSCSVPIFISTNVHFHRIGWNNKFRILNQVKGERNADKNLNKTILFDELSGIFYSLVVWI